MEQENGHKVQGRQCVGDRERERECDTGRDSKSFNHFFLLLLLLLSAPFGNAVTTLNARQKGAALNHLNVHAH